MAKRREEQEKNKPKSTDSKAPPPPPEGITPSKLGLKRGSSNQIELTEQVCPIYFIKQKSYLSSGIIE